MSKQVNINGESKTVEKVALWRDAAHTAREMFVPEGTVPPGYVPEGTVPDGYVPDAVPTVSASAGISRSGHIVTARAEAEAACNGHTASDADTESLDLTQGTGLEAAAILAGRSVLGIDGTATADATAAAADIASGKTAYINGVKVIGSMMPETCPVPSYDTPSVSVSLGLSSDNSKLTAAASATANGKTGNGSTEKTLASLGLVKPVSVQEGGTITPGAEQVIPAGTYLSAALTILAASGGGGLPAGITEMISGVYTESAGTATRTIYFDNPMSGTPTGGLLWDESYDGSVGGIILYGVVPIVGKFRGGVRANAAAGTITLGMAGSNPSATAWSIQGGGSNWYATLTGHRYRYIVWR